MYEHCACCGKIQPPSIAMCDVNVLIRFVTFGYNLSSGGDIKYMYLCK